MSFSCKEKRFKRRLCLRSIFPFYKPFRVWIDCKKLYNVWMGLIFANWICDHFKKTYLFHRPEIRGLKHFNDITFCKNTCHDWFTLCNRKIRSETWTNWGFFCVFLKRIQPTWCINLCLFLLLVLLYRVFHNCRRPLQVSQHLDKSFFLHITYSNRKEIHWLWSKNFVKLTARMCTHEWKEIQNRHSEMHWKVFDRHF